MAETYDSHTTKEIVRQLVPFLSRKGIPITPENYRVWFEYFLGRKEEIKTRLDNLLAGDTPFTPELNDRLYTEFFVRNLVEEDTQKLKIEMETADSVSRKASELVVGIMKDVLGSAESTSEYGGKLKKYVIDMDKANRIEDVQNVLKSMLRDTQETATQSYKVSKKLETSSERLESLNMELVSARKEARSDNLTGLANRRAFDEQMDETLKLVKTGRAHSLLMMDIDYFKKFNDEYGHLIGDKLLRQVAKEIRGTISSGAGAFRFGGEEFSVIFPGPLDAAAALGEKIRKAIEEIAFLVRGAEIEVTISVGVALLVPGDTLKSAVERGDKAMYAAKHSGRNAVRTENEAEAPC